MKAQLGLPDMKLPIQYAMAYPDRLPNTFERFNFLDYPNLSFEQPDLKTFRNLQLAYNAMNMGGNAACILNAANEVVVDAFLKEKVGFLQMSDIIEDTLQKCTFVPQPTLEDYIASDAEARRITTDKI
jgi:1-deoxy-D-xylulose-5-phosphate reductoisomerase